MGLRLCDSSIIAEILRLTAAKLLLECATAFKSAKNGHVKSSAQASVDLIKGGTTSQNKKQKQKAKNTQFKSRVTTSTTDAKGIDVNIKADGAKKT